MRYIAAAETDIGIIKDTNQDSIMFRHVSAGKGEVLMAVICDGMGGLSKGELASKTVVLEFSKWFEEELPYELEDLDMDVIGAKWSIMLRQLNTKIATYGSRNNVTLGTTFTGVLMAEDELLCVHVGDTRLYQLTNKLRQVTEDQTFINREIRNGRMTAEQAKTDKRRNVLLQCVGASEMVEPQIIRERVERGVYLLCSDGFRHEITEDEIMESLAPVNLVNVKAMHSNARYLIDTVKSRREKDNISAILIKAD